jgi:hypothetical protein
MDATPVASMPHLSSPRDLLLPALSLSMRTLRIPQRIAAIADGTVPHIGSNIMGRALTCEAIRLAERFGVSIDWIATGGQIAGARDDEIPQAPGGGPLPSPTKH